MNVSINQLVKSLLQKESLEHCSLPELTAYAERNPYFGAAQLLLAKKLQTESPDQFEEQYQKTLLYFHNPLWVEHLLNDTGVAEMERVNEVDRVEKVDEVEKEGEVDRVEKVDEVVEVEKEDEVVEVEKEVEVDKVEKEDLVVKEVIMDQLPDEEKLETIEITNHLAAPVIEAEIPELQVNPVPVPVEAVNPANDLVFEPFHTVDYFASQGIRFKEEERPTDEFGKQLKSFTDWLKTLKRLPAIDLAKNVNPQAERKVEQLAGQSITDREILTEAMAEVWEKQGNTLKAIEIYRKLSLLEPAKSPYFAAKIEGLKKKN